jgi:hypothetical protein
MKTYLLLLLILGYATASYGHPNSFTNRISRSLRGTMYTAQPSTVKRAYRNRNKNVLNCGGYAFRIKDVADKSGVKSEIWLVGGKHVVIIVVVKGKRTCYSNGKVVREAAYSKIKRLK